MDSQRVDLKNTLNLMRTDFPMKANLPQSEPKMLERWQQQDIYAQVRKAREGRPPYEMIYLGSDLFSVPETGDEVQFRRTAGQVTSFDLVTAEGRIARADRTS